ncbi:inner membrane protein YbhN [Enterobacter hormaechei]|nr:inner membrane protein YbhN [Enterobacter hormaechei]
MSKSHPRWRLAKKILTWLFFIAVAVLLVVYAQKVDWEEVWKVIRNYNRTVLLGAGWPGDCELPDVRLL